MIDPKKRLAVSLGAGLLLSFAVWLYLKRAQQKIISQYTMTTVVQAKKYIAQGKMLTEDQLEEVPVPIAYLAPTAVLKKAELRSVDGKLHWKAGVGLLKGEQITKSKLYEESALKRLSWMIPSGQTAFTLRLPIEQAIGGNLYPGDRVNLLSTIDAQPGWPQAETRLIIQSVLVVAVEDQVWDPAGSQADRLETKWLSNESILVTLSVSPRQAAQAVLSVEKGKPQLTLVSALDLKPSMKSSASLQSLREGSSIE